MPKITAESLLANRLIEATPLAHTRNAAAIVDYGNLAKLCRLRIIENPTDVWVRETEESVSFDQWIADNANKYFVSNQAHPLFRAIEKRLQKLRKESGDTASRRQGRNRNVMIDGMRITEWVLLKLEECGVDEETREEVANAMDKSKITE